MSLDKESILFYSVIIIFVVTATVTILGIIQKVTIEKKYLNGLFTALILELVAAVIFMFSKIELSTSDAFAANQTNINNQISNQLEIEKSAVDRFILTLPADIQGTMAEVRTKLQNKYLEFESTKEKLVKAENKINVLEQQSAAKDSFLNKVSELENRRIKLHKTINLKHKVDQKYDIYLLVQKILQRIGFYQGDLDGDALKTQESLKNYKISVGLTDERYLTTVTQQTVIFIVRDYAKLLLEELIK